MILTVHIHSHVGWNMSRIQENSKVISGDQEIFYRGVGRNFFKGGGSF